MSTCISTHGEYSDHELTDADPFVCQRCWVFDEVAAMNRIRHLSAQVAAASALADHWEKVANPTGWAAIRHTLAMDVPAFPAKSAAKALRSALKESE